MLRFIAFSRSRRIRSSAFLFTLALTDAFFLLDLLPGMIHTAFFSNLYRKINIICNIQTYVSFVASFVHIWMVLAFTAERFFAVNFPLKHMSQCTPAVSRAVIGIILIPALFCYIHPAFFVSEVDERGQCREKDNYERYLNNLNMFDTILTMFLPFILVSILNILIIRKLFCSKTFRQHVFANGSRYQCRRTSNWSQPASSSPIKPGIPSSSPTRSCQTQRMIPTLRLPDKSAAYRTFNNSESSQMNLNNGTMSNVKTKRPSKKNESAQRHILTELRLTKMLLAISLTCLSLNFPSYYLRFMFLYEKSRESSASDTAPSSNEIDLAFYRDVIFHYMSYFSYSINLFIYLLFGGNFRRALKRLFSLTIKRPENFNSTTRGKKLYDNEHTYDYDSIGVTLISTNGSLRSHSKLTEQTSLRRAPVRHSPNQINQENQT